MARAFQLRQEPLFRVLLLRLGDDEYVFSMNMHHIISDGLSLKILMEEFVQGYLAQGSLAALARLSIDYTDYAAWQQDQLQGEALEKLSATGGTVCMMPRNC